jgi:hypothetical protein
MDTRYTTTTAAALIAMTSGADAYAAAPEVPAIEARSESDDVVRLGLLLQATGSWGRQGDEPTGAQASWRRVRPKISATLLERRLDVATQWSFTPRAVELLDAHAELEAAPALRVRVGQYKIPFTRYRMGSIAELALVDWPRLTKFFGGERQLGVTAHSGWKGDGEWGYHVGVFTGSNARAAHGVGAPLLYGRARPNPSDLLEPGAPAPRGALPEVVAHGSWRPVGEAGDARGWRARLDASVALDAGACAGEDTAARAALEATVGVAGVTLTTVGYLGVLERVADPGRHDLSLLGALGELSVHVAPVTTLAVRATALEVAEATRRDVAADRDARGADHDVTHGERALAVGVKVDLWGDALVLGLDAELAERRLDSGSRRRVDARAQLQARF